MAYLDVKALTKLFGGLAAVNGVSFGVERGEIVGLIGPNGAGKTTIFNLINGFLAPTSGEVRFEGKLLNGMKPHQVCRSGIARTFQVVKPLQRMTVLENVMASSFLKHPTVAAARSHAAEVLEFTGLSEVAGVVSKGLPLGLRKRLEIARALATRPSLLLLDEACAGLNPSELDQNIAMIRQISQTGITILVIEHHMKVIMSISHRVVVLNFGEKIAEGTGPEVAANPDVIAAYLGGEAPNA